MSQVIRVTEDVYSRLAQQAKGFEKPSDVIEKLLNFYENNETNAPLPSLSKETKKKKNSSEFIFNNSKLGKGRLVLSVMKQYVADHPDTSYQDLFTIFPKAVQGSQGVFQKLEDAESIFHRTKHKRHFIKPNEIIKLKNNTIAISTEWGKDNIYNFIKIAEKHGYKITENN